jgi:hypothetical protein
MDGKKQRQAYTAAERAVEALLAGDGAGARRAFEHAVELDQIGLYAPAWPWIEQAASDVDGTGRVDPVTRRGLIEALGPGPLAALLESAAGSD